MTIRSSRRPAFTLIELIVVIGIIVIMATLAVMFLPNLDSHKGVPNAVSQLHGWVHLSRMQAIRDGTGHGVRLIDDGGGRVTTIQYIEQPDPIAPRGPGIRIMIRTEPCYDPLLFPTPPNIGDLSVVTLYQDLTPPVPPPGSYPVSYLTPPPDQPPTPWINWDGVQPGDYFQLMGSPSVFAGIRRFTTTSPQVPLPPPPQGHPLAQLVLDRVVEGTERPMPYTVPAPPNVGNVIVASDNFRVIRQPRPLIGEPMLQLHKDVYIDLTRSHPCPQYITAQGLKQFPNNFQASADWSPTVDPSTGFAYLDILFNSSGNVANAPYGQVFLWVQHKERPTDALLLSIYTRTGKVAPFSVYDLNPQMFDPYGIARAGQTPGL
jgi:prepilin-type N-terminal cleavage/methylation domain-containing protein